jgi:hypothetical protein
MRAVLALRSEYGPPQKILSDEKQYQSAVYCERAMAALA